MGVLGAARKAVVNIGLKKGKTAEDIPVAEALAQLESQGVSVDGYRIIDSQSEPTLIAELDRPLTKDEGDALSVALDQEAVAQKTPGGGDLFGPKADEWGPFSDEYFLDIDAAGAFPERKTSSVPAEQAGLERFQPARGEPANVPGFFEDDSSLRELVAAGQEMGADKWYHTGGIKDEFIGELGEEAGAPAFDRFMDLKAATSPRSTVAQNLKRASILHQRGMRGESLNPGPEAFPKGYGHMAHRSAHLPGLTRLQETGQVGSGVDQPKVASYAANLKGNYQPVTVDTHNYQIVSGQKKSPTAAQYPFLEQRQQALAGELGLDPAEFQSALWAGAGDITGVRNVDNVTSALNTRIENTARELGVTEAEAKRRFIRGDTPLYAAAGAGVLAGLAPEDDAMAAGFKGPALRLANKAKNIQGRVARGDITPDQGQRLLIGDDDKPGVLGELNKMSGRRINPNVRGALADEVYGVYEQVGKMTPRGGGDVRGEVMSADIATEALPQLADRPFTPEEAAGYDQYKQLSREMGEKPFAPSLSAAGQHVNDPFTNFQPQPAITSQSLGINTPAEVGANNPKIVYTAQQGAAPKGSSGFPDPTPAEIAARPTGVVAPTKELSMPGTQKFFNPETRQYDLDSPAGRSNPVRGVGPASGLGLGAALYDEAAEASGVLSNDGRISASDVPLNLQGEPLFSEDSGTLGTMGRAVQGLGQLGMDAIHGLAAKAGAGLYGVGQMAGGVLSDDPKSLGTIANEMGALEQNIMDIDRPWIGESGEAEYEDVLAKALSNPNVLQALEWIGAAPARAGSAVADTQIGRYNPEVPAAVEGVLGTFTEIL